MDEFKWRVSKSGFSIVSGEGDTYNTIAKCPGQLRPPNDEDLQNWLMNAELICELFNNTLK